MNTFIHYHTLDLRLHDSPSLHQAHSPNNTSTHFLPIYIFDPRQLDLSHLSNISSPPAPRAGEPAEHQNASLKYQPKSTRCSPLSRVGGFHRTSPYRLKFLLEAVFSLRESYRKSGGDMLLACGPPEVILPKIVDQLKKDEGKIEGIHAQREYTVEEISNYRRIQSSLDEEIVLHDSKTLIPPKHLPFKPELDTPDVYTEFRKQVEGLGIGLNEMLVKPLDTAKPLNGEIKTKGKLKPFPKIEAEMLNLKEGQGGIIGAEETLEGLYVKLVKPLLDNPPIGGWSSTSSPKEGTPNLHPKSAIPFKGTEVAALERVDDYIGHANGDKWEEGMKARHYKETRNGLLGEGFSTKFSTWLCLGIISPKVIGWRVGELLEKEGKDKEVWKNVYWILFELLWRDYFQYTVLKTSLTPSSKSKSQLRDPLNPNSSLFNPDGFSSQISTYPQNLRPNPSEWEKSNLEDPNDNARRWCEGRTGVPFIDANMRELVQTGWMSNRGRQNVASFLTKDLYCDWRIGAEFFEMNLVDYDTCSNWGNWQYQAGVGNDPRSSRQFNPIKQANDYDEDNGFVRTWIPELERVGDEYVQTPWLINDKSKLGDYPSRPIVELPSWKKHYPNQPPHRNRGKAKGNGKGPKGGRNGG
ncbi:hypothetical protein I302_107745 [Kwoniella bestiolae CBS 10118]|uniref:Cryptochrome DASH n=1 Tax=Kwoniella bestiolae CBS 10118 TaxID=1296100 RepID=A0A1B9FXM8_9TREE|nr:hypothetical protein I302_06516 [Kwoniella bestiolae CBS 10118]OCF23533.1 hypothetical protein I302_06516 [Kwoniella bestiolae CBS 10118]